MKFMLNVQCIIHLILMLVKRFLNVLVKITDLDQAFATWSRFTEWALPSSGQNIDVATYFPNETLIITLMPKREKILPMMPIF